MLYYMTTKEHDEINVLFREFLLGLKSRVTQFVTDSVPSELEADKKAMSRLWDLELRIAQAIMNTDEDIYHPDMICAMNEKGIRWGRFIGLPIGKRLVIIDEDGDKYSFVDFDALVGETCELTDVDERILSDIRAVQDEPESDRYRIYVPEIKTSRMNGR